MVGADYLGRAERVSLAGRDRGLHPVADWHWRSLPLSGRTGRQVFDILFGLEPVATLLESPYPASPDFPQLGQFSICAGGARAGQIWRPEIGGILGMLRSRLASVANPLLGPKHLPFIGGWLGWLGYDLAWEIERLPEKNSDALPFPVAYWYEPENFAVLDHGAQVLWLAVSAVGEGDRLARILEEEPDPLGREPIPAPRDKIPARHKIPPNPPLKGEDRSCDIQFLTEQAAFEAAVLRAKAHIRAGDIFQTNLSLRFETQTSLSSWAIYQNLQRINPSPFASYWRTPWGDVVSCSPERLVKVRGRQVESRPIAGTRKRGANPEEDDRLAQELLENPKERAEHIMLVDLERNDLGRVCAWGSVVVDELLAIERYSHVMHLVSNVVGRLDRAYDSVDLIQAAFPGGTITGCPKVRCMEIIEALEPVRRSLFYGSCGYLDGRGDLDLNILIRTLLCAGDQVWGQVGAGIVADSDPEREWLESLQKAQAQLGALSG
jgi:para-aminobenzoate synthetase component I